jgi:hypothetical protein
MAKKTVKLRQWTATDDKLRGLAKKESWRDQIAKALKRTGGASAVKAHQLGVSLDAWEQIRRPNTFTDSADLRTAWVDSSNQNGLFQRLAVLSAQS